jgi:hypothetical protein
MMKDQMTRMGAYNKEMVRSTVKTMAAFQDHAQTAIRIGVENLPYLPDSGKSIIQQWASNMKKNSDFLHKTMLESSDRYAAAVKAWE